MGLLKKWLRKPEREITIHETLLVGICLAAAGGFLDAYTYTLRGGVFANAQTGNLVLLALRAAQGDWQGAFYYVIPVAAFFCGILLTETIKLRTSDPGIFFCGSTSPCWWRWRCWRWWAFCPCLSRMRW